MTQDQVNKIVRFLVRDGYMTPDQEAWAALDLYRYVQKEFSETYRQEQVIQEFEKLTKDFAKLLDMAMGHKPQDITDEDVEFIKALEELSDQDDKPISDEEFLQTLATEFDAPATVWGRDRLGKVVQKPAPDGPLDPYYCTQDVVGEEVGAMWCCLRQSGVYSVRYHNFSHKPFNKMMRGSILLHGKPIIAFSVNLDGAFAFTALDADFSGRPAVVNAIHNGSHLLIQWSGPVQPETTQLSVSYEFALEK